MFKANRLHIKSFTLDALTILVAAALVGYAAHTYQQKVAKTRSGVRILSRGRDLPRIPGFDYGQSRQTLILVLRSSCPYCRHDIPFYNDASAAARISGKTRIVALFPEDDNPQQFMSAVRGDVKLLDGSGFRKLNLELTPTLILIDDHGRVRDYWVGALDNSAARAILDAL